MTVVPCALNHPRARQESTALFREMFGVCERQGELLTLSVVTALMLDHHRGDPPIHIREDTYYIGDRPLLPYLRQLQDLRESYHAQVGVEPYKAYGEVQERLRQLLNPSRVAQVQEA